MPDPYSNANSVMMHMERDGITDKKVINTVAAALATVGKEKHGKGYAPSGVEFQHWTKRAGNRCCQEGLNCWTALIWWAFTGGAIDQSTINEYASELRAVAADMEAENHIMYSFLRANQTIDIASTDKPAPGRTIVFGDPGWKRPTNHVVLSIGGGYVVSPQSARGTPQQMNEPFDIILNLHLTEKATILSETGNQYVFRVKPSANNKFAALTPGIPFNDLVGGLTHISRIDYIDEGAGGGDRIRMTTKPFWELPRLKWMG